MHLPQQTVPNVSLKSKHSTQMWQSCYLWLLTCSHCWTVLLFPHQWKNGGNTWASETSLVSFTLRQSIYPNEKCLTYILHEQEHRSLLTLPQFWQMENCSVFTGLNVLCSCREFKIMPSFSQQLPWSRQAGSWLYPVCYTQALQPGIVTPTGTAAGQKNRGAIIPPSLQGIYPC